MNGIGFSPGDLVADRYRISRLLGVGAMGSVYECADSHLGDQKLALKIFHPTLQHRPEFAGRFEREVLAARLVTSPFVVRSYDLVTGKGLLGLTMELCSGGSLQDKLDERPQGLSKSSTVLFLLQLLAGLHAIHEAVILHRDLKPQNVLIGQGGLLKISDFSVARIDSALKITQTGAAVGSVAYMSPETLLGHKVDVRSDLYSVGLIGYQMLTGKPARSESGAIATLLDSIRKPVPSVKEVAECPAPLAAAIDRVLQVDPQSRFETAAQFYDELVSIADRMPTLSRPTQLPVRLGNGASVSPSKGEIGKGRSKSDPMGNADPEAKVARGAFLSPTHLNSVIQDRPFFVTLFFVTLFGLAGFSVSTYYASTEQGVVSWTVNSASFGIALGMMFGLVLGLLIVFADAIRSRQDLFKILFMCAGAIGVVVFSSHRLYHLAELINRNLTTGGSAGGSMKLGLPVSPNLFYGILMALAAALSALVARGVAGLVVSLAVAARVVATHWIFVAIIVVALVALQFVSR